MLRTRAEKQGILPVFRLRFPLFFGLMYSTK
jgi:hypothetical protein